MRATRFGSTRWSRPPAARSSTRTATWRSTRPRSGRRRSSSAWPRAAPPTACRTTARTRLVSASRRAAPTSRSTTKLIYPSAEAIKGFQEKIGWAPWPSVEPGRPSKVTVGGINLGVGAFSEEPDLAFEAAECLAQPDNQIVASVKGGLAPTDEALYEIRRSDPTRTRMCAARVARQRRGAATSPRRTATSRSPSKSRSTRPKIDPAEVGDDLRDKLDTAAEGASSDGGRAGPGADRHGSRRRRA